MWNPEKYLQFADHRGRPFSDLLARVGADTPRTVVDLGCGPGNLTQILARRWPEANLLAIDSSPDMVAEARRRGIAATVESIDTWQPSDDVEVVFSNAALQWVPNHPDLLARWAEHLSPGAWIAAQVPGNFNAASHVLVRELAVEPGWRGRLEAVQLLGERAVLDPAQYAELLSQHNVDVWETTYIHRLEGADAVLEWITGTALRPIRAVLGDDDWAEFRAALAPRLASAYPRRSDGTTWFPFRRIFLVARIR